MKRNAAYSVEGNPSQTLTRPHARAGEPGGLGHLQLHAELARRAAAEQVRLHRRGLRALRAGDAWGRQS